MISENRCAIMRRRFWRADDTGGTSIPAHYAAISLFIPCTSSFLFAHATRRIVTRPTGFHARFLPKVRREDGSLDQMGGDDVQDEVYRVCCVGCGCVPRLDCGPGAATAAAITQYDLFR